MTTSPPDSASADLASLRPPLEVFYRALAGPGSPAVEELEALADLPSTVDVFAQPDANQAWYRVAVAHRAAHLAFRMPAEHADGYQPGIPLAAFTRSFAQPAAARALVQVLEECRVDALTEHQYPGLRRALWSVQAMELQARPPLALLPPPVAAYEALVQLSLGLQPEVLPALLTVEEIIPAVAGAAERVRAPNATISDAVAAAEEVYEVIEALADAASEQAALDLAEVWSMLPRVSYREAPTRQLIAVVDAVPDQDLRAEDLKRAVELPEEDVQHLPEQPNIETTENANNEAPPPKAQDTDDESPSPAQEGQALLPFGTAGGAADEVAVALNAFQYPEWDYRTQRYRRDWCTVYEQFPVASLSAQLLRETLRTYAHLLPRIHRHLKLITPRGYRLVRRVEHGDDIDLDASVEALLDLRAGLIPSDRLEIHREPRRREIATAFLLDLSGSTAEYLKMSGADPDAPPWWTTGADMAPPPVRIIDVERQCVALLLGTMEKLGDAYAIYGFSSHGPADVSFLVVKDLQERLSQEVAGRVSALEPMQGTRMGAAIRHTTRKLRAAEARTKLMLLVSDGRPFDREYGEEYGSQGRLDYAMHDTRVALDEARAAGIQPFLLTVDQRGSDYLRSMCGTTNYEVLGDVELLPERVLSLYAELIRR